MATSGRSWETAETKLLMDLRREMDHEFNVVKRNAVLWKKLSDRMNRAGYSRTDKQCKEKWKNLLSEYKVGELKIPETGRAESQKGLCEGEQQRMFPYYSHIKDILVKQPGSTLSSILDSPPPNLDNHSSNSPYHPAYNRSGQPTLPPTYSGQPSTSQYPYSHEPTPPSVTPDPSHEHPHPSSTTHYHHTSQHWYKSKVHDIISKKNDGNLNGVLNVEATSVIYQVLGLMRQEITERRRWEEQIEARQLESRRREEARERRREKRERERARRQRYYTQVLTTLASHITPNATEYLSAIPNRTDRSGSDTEKNTYTTST